MSFETPCFFTGAKTNRQRNDRNQRGYPTPHVPSTVSFADDSTSPILIVYLVASSTIALSMVKVCFLPSLVTLTLSSGDKGSPFLNQVTSLTGLASSHSNVAVSSSLTFLSFSGFVTLAGASGIHGYKTHTTSEGKRNQKEIICLNTHVSLRLRVQNAVPAQPCVGKY